MKSRKAASGSHGSTKTASTHPKSGHVTTADYKMLIETFPQWVWITDAKGSTTFCNRHWYEFSGLTAGQTYNNEWHTLIHPDDRERARSTWQNALDTGKAYESEYRYKRSRDGKYRWHLSKGIPLKNGSGKVEKWIGFGIDIHDSKTAEHELADREARLSAIVNTGPDCIKLLAADGSLLEMNQAGLAIMEADSPGQIIGKHLIERVISKQYYKAFRDLNQRIFRGEDGELIYEIVGFKGTHRWLQTHATPLRDKKGTIRAALAITRDITQQKKAEDELRASETKFRALFEHSSDAVALFDKDWKVVFCSTSIERILGVRPEDVIGHDALEWVHPDDRAPVGKTYMHVLSHPGETVTARVRLRAKNGSWKVIERNITNLLDDPNIGAIVNNVRDITEKVRIDEALRGSEERFAKAFQSSPLPVLITTWEEARFQDVNDAALELSGYSREDVIGRTVDELNLWGSPEDRAAFYQVLQESRQVKALQSTFRTRKGEIRHVELFADTIELDGVSCLLTIARDTTESLKLEAQFRQAQKMDAIGRLAGGVAHDFNNMLAVIVGYVQLLQDRVESIDSAQKHIEQIRKACERAAGLTRQLLAFSRKQIVQPRILNLNIIVNNLSKMLLRVIGEDITLSMVPGIPMGSIKADLGQIEQVLMNLIINARDAMPNGGRIIIETSNAELKENHAQHRPTVVGGSYVMLSVSDTGTGMDEPTMARIFEPFFTTKGSGKGTGLGLSMVYGIVKQSNGYIWVASEPGKGATFKMYFPRVNEEPDALVAQTFEPPIAGGSETILVVEDDPSLCELVVALLEESGYKVLEALDAKEALDIARKKKNIKLLLTDVIMPTMSGTELAKEISKLRPDIKVLFMSGYSGDLVTSHGILEAATNLVEKPFTKHTLLSKVRAVLDN
ncbi:MAG TPA: PAS domain S-box protein [Terriglobales bacterium]|nr:PAS domain S-box protein [Terriglobales bacterium]